MFTALSHDYYLRQTRVTGTYYPVFVQGAIMPWPEGATQAASQQEELLNKGHAGVQKHQGCERQCGKPVREVNEYSSKTRAGKQGSALVRYLQAPGLGNSNVQLNTSKTADAGSIAHHHGNHVQMLATMAQRRKISLL